MMTRIYQGAERVYAWLGLSDEESALGMQLLSDFTNDYVELHPPNISEWASDWVRQKLRDPGMHRCWKGLDKILANSYWDRLWIVQELVVPETLWVFLKCGFLETAFAFLDSFIGAVSYLCDTEFGGIFGAHSRRLRRIFHKITLCMAGDILEDARTWRDKDMKRMGLLDLLRKYLTSACSNPRDRAYALLGIELGKECCDLDINYSAPLQKFFLDVAQYIIERSQRLDILGVYKGSPHVLPLPSWVPDWKLIADLRSSGNYLSSPWMDLESDASANSAASTVFSHGGATLKVRCTLLGPIIICSVPNWLDDRTDGTDTLARYQLKLMGWLSFCASSLYESEFEGPNAEQPFDPETFEKLLTAFYETVIAGFYGEVSARTWPLAEFIKYCTWMVTRDEREFNSRWTTFQLEALHMATSNHLRLFSVEIQQPINPTQSSDQSISSRNSRKSIGRGDLSFAKDGDMVAIVHGCKLPILLRKEDHGYRVLSGLYVNGFMHGEAIGQFPEVDIDLI
jgi:hypothetical protein